LAQYHQAARAIRAHGESADGWVTVTRDSSGEISVNIRRGMLERCSPSQVAAEIRSALLAAVGDHHEQYRQLRIRHFGSTVGVAAFAGRELP
jgi:hypothetical protein